MGGKALLKYNVITERLSNNDFVDLKNKIGNILNDNSIIHYFVKSYNNKKSHGDLDVLILKESININNIKNDNIKNDIIKLFNPTAIYINDKVYSFDYCNFQIDFIVINENIFECSKIYYDYDPSGYLMGRYYNLYNLSYGSNGLYYNYYNKHYKFKILISKDVNKIFEFGGFDLNQYLKGFDNLEDIFKFILNSKKYVLNNNYKGNKNNINRYSIQEFFNYIKENNITFNYELIPNDVLINNINEFFPESNLINEIIKSDNIVNDINNMRNKFNGHLLMDKYENINTNNVKYYINKFKELLGSDYNNFIKNNDTNYIFNKFEELLLNPKN